MAKNYHGQCGICRAYTQVTFRNRKALIDPETGEKQKSRPFPICFNCVTG